MAAVITSISPLSGAPGTVITVTGTGFDSTAQVGCPVLVPTTLNDDGTLSAAIPADITGLGGTSMLVVVFVQNADSSISNMVQFTVMFPAVALQAWTTIDKVTAEIPMFVRGGQIPDSTINTWIRSISQSVSSCLLRRGLPLDPTQWQQPNLADASPTPSDVLEQIVRYGAAARLAEAISGQFSGGGEWGLAKNLGAAFKTEFGLLATGEYDKLFFPAAATVEAGQQVYTGQLDDSSCSDGLSTNSGFCGTGQAFCKEQIF